MPVVGVSISVAMFSVVTYRPQLEARVNRRSIRVSCLTVDHVATHAVTTSILWYTNHKRDGKSAQK